MKTFEIIPDLYTFLLFSKVYEMDDLIYYQESPARLGDGDVYGQSDSDFGLRTRSKFPETFLWLDLTDVRLV